MQGACRQDCFPATGFFIVISINGVVLNRKTLSIYYETVRIMNDVQQRKAAKAFSEYWKDKGYEKGESQKFWMSLLSDVYGVENVAQFIEFEDQVHLDHTSFIDGYIPSTKVLIEQKGLGKDLNKPIKQSDGSLLTPFQQAKRYITELPLSRHPRWVITCNFAEFYIYDMERPGGEPEKILLADLEKEYYRLSFLTETGSVHIQQEMEISIKAGEVVGLLYDAFLKQYKNPEDPETLKSLNKLCVRLVFCLYAEDAGIFGKHLMFHDYLAQFSTRDMRKALVALFKVLDQKPEERDEFLADDDPLLAAFPYVNGGLFADENVVIPPFTDEIRNLLLTKASADFDWSSISPTIFGAVFESTLNPETRRSGGMHYTSIENIHKVIDPLFLDDLKAELEEISAIAVVKTKERKLREFQAKLASLDWLDPAAGSGNFLTESYLCIRRLENDVLRLLNQGQMVIGDQLVTPILVSISQFHGIEINDFAVTVAKTALWIAESQMMKETEDIIYAHLEFLPLKTNANIVEGNALLIDWNDVIPRERLDYIMGNPPFVGASLMSAKQKKEAVDIFGKIQLSNSIDYVGAWYHIAAKYMQGTRIQAAFVSTNSITQGEQVAPLWTKLVKDYRIEIQFAYRTFIWNSEANEKAHVHCVIIGFSCCHDSKEKTLFENGNRKNVSMISPYLIEMNNVLVSSRSKPISPVRPMVYGNKPTDDGNFILSEDEREKIIAENPGIEKYIYRFVGASDYINGKKRYCFWLKGIEPSELRKYPEIAKRVAAVREFRSNSTAEPTRKKADVANEFFFISQPETTYILMPRHSSQRRRYIPFGFLQSEDIAADSCSIIPEAGLYEFGVLISNVHMAWMRTVCGRIKSDYRYSGSLVYNTFPWPNSSEEQRRRIEATAQAIIDARRKYPNSSLADLYDDTFMPPELRTAHQNNDRAVMAAYGFPIKGFTESDCVAELMKLYQKMTEKA